jgi:adenylate kinase family enzyme
VGAPSAGKSTIATRRAERLDCPCYDLESIAFVDERWTLRPIAERLTAIEQIVRQPAWVTKGGHLGWTEPLLGAADAIVWFDPPLHVLLQRHWVRHRQRGLWWLVRYGWSWQVLWYLQDYQHDLAPDTDVVISRAATAGAIGMFWSERGATRLLLALMGLTRCCRISGLDLATRLHGRAIWTSH